MGSRASAEANTTPKLAATTTLVDDGQASDVEFFIDGETIQFGGNEKKILAF
jgi:endonuclease YncB( thermonuclease family)